MEASLVVAIFIRDLYINDCGVWRGGGNGVLREKRQQIDRCKGSLEIGTTFQAVSPVYIYVLPASGT